MKEIINYGGRLVGYETIMKEKFEIILRENHRKNLIFWRKIMKNHEI